MVAIITHADAQHADRVDAPAVRGDRYRRLVLLRSSCGICEVGSGPVCTACASALLPVASLAPPLHLDACAAALDYDGARSLVTSLKNGQRRDLAGWLATRIAGALDPPCGAVVTWAPTSGARRRSRGFDQAELLARATARRWELPCRPLLRRAAPPQAGRSAGERRGNPAFSVVRPAPATVVVGDDVATSGATLTAAARALRAAGATTVVGAVAARSAGRSARRRSTA
jgi:predicted amidophosphoribosyltransferase